MLVKTNKYGQIIPIIPKFIKNKIITKKLVIKSIMFYKNLIIKYYPHNIPSKWLLYLNKLLAPNYNIKTDFTSYNKYILRLQCLLNDSHCYTYRRLNFIYDGAFLLDIRKNNIICIGSNNPNLPKGSIIKKINNENIDDYLDKYIKYSRGHNKFLRRYYALQYFVSVSNNKINKITYNINNKLITRYVKFGLYKPFIPKYNFFEIIKNKMIINPLSNKCDKNTIYKIIKYISITKYNIKTIVFDMRQYPYNSNIMFLLIRHLNTSNKSIHFINYYNANSNGTYSKIKLFIDPIKRYKPNIDYKINKNLKIVILVDHKTLSTSEHLTIALQSLNKIYNVKTIGAPTSGSNGDLVNIEMLYGIVITTNFNYTEYPNNKKIQRKGVLLDKII